jgi:hypothetical protein
MSDDYEIDGDGNRVLIGLSPAETKEFLKLEETIQRWLAPVSSKEWKTPDELRWLTLYHKHEARKLLFLAAKGTAH